MTNQLRRLRSLALAQVQIGKVLEVRISHEERALSGLLKTRRELMELAENVVGSDAAFLPRVLLALASTEQELIRRRKGIEVIHQELLAARGREKIVSEKHSSLAEAGERKLIETELLDVALYMTAKASRKRGQVS